MWNLANRIPLFTALLFAGSVQAATGNGPAQYGEPSAAPPRTPKLDDESRFGTGFEARMESYSSRAERPERVERSGRTERIERVERGRAR